MARMKCPACGNNDPLNKGIFMCPVCGDVRCTNSRCKGTSRTYFRSTTREGALCANCKRSDAKLKKVGA